MPCDGGWSMDSTATTKRKNGNFAADALEIVQIKRNFRGAGNASRCKTALAEPPVAITTAMAFSNASFVKIFRAVRPLRIASAQTKAELYALSAFSQSSAAIVEE